MAHEKMSTTQEYRASVVTHDGTQYALINLANQEKQLLVRSDTAGFHGTDASGARFCPQTPENLATLRTRLPG